MPTLDPDAVVFRSATLREVGRAEDSLTMVQEALREHPSHTELLLALCSSLIDLQRLPDAEASARAALASAPASTSARLALVNVFLRQERLDEAGAVALEVVQLDPDLPAGHANLALAGLGRRDAASRRYARDAYRRSLELSRGAPDFLVVAALLERDFGDDAAARSLIEEGLAQAPLHERLLALRAQYAAIGEQTELLSDVLSTNPGDVASREVLDSVFTWRRRLAFSAVLVGPLLPTAALAASRSAVALVVSVVAILLGGVAAWRAFRRYRDTLSPGYLAVLRAEFRGRRAAGTMAGAGAVLLIAGAGAAFAQVAVAGILLLAASLCSVVATGFVFADDARVLDAVGDRSGRTWKGTAARFGRLRQELSAWTAIGAGLGGVLVATSAFAAHGDEAARVVAAAGGPAFAAVAVIALVEVLRWRRHVPRRYWAGYGLRLRFAFSAIGVVATCAITLGLLFGPTS